MKNYNFIQQKFFKIYRYKKPQSVGCLKKLWLQNYHIFNQKNQYFHQIWKYSTDTELFSELIFCILTPQSKAKLCWEATKLLHDRINNITIMNILNSIKHIRFKNRKAKYIIQAKKFFTLNETLNVRSQLQHFYNIYKLREWLVNNVKGIGYKEASHFLRNIGLGDNLAILDRHILKNLKYFNVIDSVPLLITKNIYFIIENKMQSFSRNIKIPMSHLDMLFWGIETGIIFK
ncbi:MAG: N-glycosylase/DNA lyase [Endomicrobium sp.]|jgi:N-glycosylase/DNA lyase|nr:N-glycosylase/DNA lyase [Endomicrobium sp.]